MDYDEIIAKHEYPHGTNARYVFGRCRCDACRAANSASRKRRDYLKRTGRSPDVDAAEARAHVLALMGTGMGYKRIAQAAGVDPKTVYILVAGRAERGTPPPKRIRRTTAEKLLAVRPTVRRKQAIDALPYWWMIADLMGLGYSKAWISERIGQGGRALQIGDRFIHVETALKIKRLWETTTTPAPEASHHERQVASRSRNYAKTLRNRLYARQKYVPKPRSGRGTRRPDRTHRTVS